MDLNNRIMIKFRTGLSLFLVGMLLSRCATTGSEMAVITERPVAVVETYEEDTETEPLPDSVEGIDENTVSAGQFDFGKMWTFDQPPLDYFQEAYGLDLSEQWFDLASRGALRFSDNCSASFVSPYGLVMTNHHCARENISAVSRDGEALMNRGFYASSLEEERRVKDLYVDQLVSIADVTKRVRDGVPDYQNDEEEADARDRRIESIERSLTQRAKDQDTTYHVQVVSLYDGGTYSAYTFKRYRDVRLVIAPEHAVAKFGGESDNFTFPRYSLDMTFFRVYDYDGNPLETTHYFPWSTNGVKSGDPVFVVGNPGSTSRLKTISQLEFERDFALPQQLEVLRTRGDIMRKYLVENPDEPGIDDVRNSFLSIANSIKALGGQLEGLNDDYLLARKRASEESMRSMIEQNEDLNEKFGSVLNDLAGVQRSKRATAKKSGALTYFGTSIGSRVLTRGLYGYVYSLLKQRGAPPSRLQELKSDAADIKDFPPELEKAFIVARINELSKYLGRSDPSLRRLLQGGSPEELAQRIVDSTALVDSSSFFTILDEGYLASDDVSVPVTNVLAPLYFTLGQQNGSFSAREENLSEKLAQARLELFGTGIPPDATFSLRLSDGVVSGYAYNGTQSPFQTTFFGMYDHYHTYGPGSEWDLPDRWLSPPASFDLSTPLNIVSTNDITGGNSGSPLLNANLEIVGLIFDGNIESLPNQYVYRDETARAISVDARGILEVLDDMYDADRLVLELTRGEVVATESEADAVLSGE